MSTLFKTTLLGLFFGTFGTTLGGIIGVLNKNSSNRFLSFLLSLASGLMLSVVCFDLIPEALEIAKLITIFKGIIVGIICMLICEYIVEKRIEKSQSQRMLRQRNGTEKEKNDLLKTGIITSVGLALHNLPEGLAIGSGFATSLTLGYSLAIAICIHDIPEGISMAIPMKNGGMKATKVLFYVFISGITTGIGAFFGKIIGEISQNIIATCLSLAAGAMLYIVSGELIPEYNKLYSGKTSTIGNIIGFLLGLIATNF